jgi:hypothetical protein
MPFTLSILDETTAGARQNAGEFQFEISTSTLREIIQQRVRQEVERFNQSDFQVFRGLIQPGETERILNDVRERPFLDWQKQYDRAVAAFNGNGFLVFVDDRQITDLDETLHLTAQTKIAFLKLVPLIGG